MACCALAVLILIQILTPLRRLRALLGFAESSVNEETNWQPDRSNPRPSPPTTSLRSRLSPLLLVQLLALAGLLVLHVAAP